MVPTRQRRAGVGGLFWLPPPIAVIVRCVREDRAGAADQSSCVGGADDRGAAWALSGRYFENKFGEQLVFVHDGEPDATVLLGGVDWEPRRVSDAGGLPDVGDLIVTDEERAFVTACWIATAW